MDFREAVFRQTAAVAVGVALCSAVMVGVFALMGLFDLPVVLGAAAGTLLSVLNFFAMAVCAGLAADKAAAGDVTGGKSLMGGSFLGRMAVLFVLLAACAMSGYFDLLALVLPQVFVRPAIAMAEFFRKSGDSEA